MPPAPKLGTLKAENVYDLTGVVAVVTGPRAFALLFGSKLTM